MTQPTKWSAPLGSGADVQDLPDDDLRYASFSKIFPQITQVPLSAGGVAPRRIDFNSLFKLLADNIYYYQNGGVFEYSDTADYEKGAIVRYNDKIYLCIQDNSALNTHNPEDIDYWLRVALNNELSDYLPLAGGNLTGNLTVQNKNVVRTVNDIEADVNGNVVIESGASFLTGQLIQSIVPLNDAMLHLADGALISGSGSYAEFVTFMAGKVSTNPELFVSEAVWQQSITNYDECGKFVYDANANTIRLPKLNGYLTVTNNQEDLGKLTEAGLPNITGSITGFEQNQNYGGAFYKSSSYTDWNIIGEIDADAVTVNFDASRSSPVYGKSNTVTTQNIKVFCYVVLGTVSKTDIQIDIDNVLSDLANKADKDLSNIPNSKGILVESYHNGSSWYRVYSDGWCEQGGSNVSGKITLLKAFANTNYIVTTRMLSGSNNVEWYEYGENTNKTTTTFTVGTRPVNWYACGYIR